MALRTPAAPYAGVSRAVGIAVNIYYRRQHEEAERKTRAKSRAKGGSGSAYGAEVLSGYYQPVA